MAEKSDGTSAIMEKFYYSPQGYWRGLAAIPKLAAAAKVSENEARDWLAKQAVWQLYLPAPRRIPRPHFNVTSPNEVHQADLLYLPHDRVKRRTYKYALTLVDIGSRFKEAEPLATKDSKEVADAFERIYKRSPLAFPKLLQVDPGKEFWGSVSTLMVKHGTAIRRGRVDLHRDQGIVERFNRTLAERLFGHQYAQEMLLAARGSSDRSAEWVARLPAVIAALNNEPTRLTGKKPVDAIKLQRVTAQPSSVVPGRLVGLEERLIPSDAQVRYLYQPGELEGGRRRATDPVWSVTLHSVRNALRQAGQPAVYYQEDGPTRGFVREELMIIPPETELPPDRILTSLREAFTRPDDTN